MSTHNIGFYEDLTKNIFKVSIIIKFHQIRTLRGGWHAGHCKHTVDRQGSDTSYTVADTAPGGWCMMGDESWIVAYRVCCPCFPCNLRLYHRAGNSLEDLRLHSFLI